MGFLRTRSWTSTSDMSASAESLVLAGCVPCQLALQIFFEWGTDACGIVLKIFDARAGASLGHGICSSLSEVNAFVKRHVEGIRRPMLKNRYQNFRHFPWHRAVFFCKAQTRLSFLVHWMFRSSPIFLGRLALGILLSYKNK